MSTFEPDSSRQREPFHPSADPDRFFESEIGAEVFRRLLAALAGRAPLAILTGPPGTGKTALLRRLSAELERSGCRVIVEPLPLSLDDLLGRLPAADPGRRVVVALDEAQALSRDVLEAIEPLRGVRADVRLLLVGQLAVETNLAELASPGQAIREAERCRLEPLAHAEVGSYIACRWAASRPGSHPFTPNAVDRVAEASGGVPQMINLICSLALRAADTRALDQVSVDLVDEVTDGLPSARARRAARRGPRRREPMPASPRGTRAAMVAAAVIPPLLVSLFLFLRPAPHDSARATVAPPPPEPRVVATRAPDPPSVAPPARPAPPVPAPAQSAAAPTPLPPPAPPASAAPSVLPAPAAPAPSPSTAATAPSAPAAPPAPVPPAATAPAADDARPSSPELPPAGAPKPSLPLATAAVAPMLPPRAMTPLPPRPPAAARPRDAGKDEALLRRAEAGDLRGVQNLLTEGAAPDARDPGGFTPLMFATIHGHAAVADALIAGGARVNLQNKAGLTPLMLAAINNHPPVLRSLIDHGADMNERTKAGWTALTYAAWRGHAGIVRVLLARGADPNVRDREGWTILQYASWRVSEPAGSDDLPEPSAGAGRPVTVPGHSEVVALLRQAGARR
jgi:type II secretory pathway predicted ATPase ExeA